MAILKIIEDFKRRRGVSKLIGGVRYDRVLIVITDGPDTNQKDVLVAVAPAGSPVARVPRPGEQFEGRVGRDVQDASQPTGDPFATVRKVQADPHEDQPNMWIVRVLYSSEAEEESGGGNPIDLRPRSRWASAARNVELVKDADGKELVSTAGVPYDPPVMHEVYDSVYVVNWNLAASAFDQNNYHDIVGSVNRDTLTIKGFTFYAREARFTLLDARESWATIADEEIHYWAMTTQFIRKKGGWDIEVASWGVQERVSAGSVELIAIMVPAPSTPGEPVDTAIRVETRTKRPLDEHGLYNHEEGPVTSQPHWEPYRPDATHTWRDRFPP